MPSLIPEHPGRQYWRSLDQLADTPEFRRYLETEFPSLAPELTGPSRRTFLKLMGASLALAGVTGCRWPRENLLPLTRRPNDRVPGVPQKFATSFELNGVATGLLVSSVDGRPIKIEGNPEHPFSRGKTDALMQASVLELYDPDRSQQVLELVAGGTAPGSSGAPQARTWDKFASTFATPHFAQLRSAGGAGLAVLAEPSGSPTRADLQARFLSAFPQARWYEYTPLSRDNERAATRLAFGLPLRPQLHLDQAEVILSVDEDFLGTHPAAVRYSGEFAARRRAADGTMSRLYVVESGLTITGAQADHRLAVTPHETGPILLGVASALAASGLSLPNAPTLEPRGAGTPGSLALTIAHDLRKAGKRAVIAVGPHVPPEIAALAHILNLSLGSVGTTVDYFPEPQPERPAHFAAIRELAQRMSAGEVQTLVILGGNPAYDAPADLGFAAALAKVPHSLHLGLYANETAQRCQWHVPQTHFLEAWGDARAWDGTVSLLQPLIDPFYPDSRTPSELLAVLAGDALQRGDELTRRAFEVQFPGGEPERAWKEAVHLGLVPDSGWAAVSVSADPRWQNGLATAWAAPTPSAGTYTVVFRPDYKLYDGRFANNGWLQEMPEPITKLTWDNAAIVSPKDAAALGIKKNGDVLELRAGGATLEIAAYLLPGQPAGVLTLPLGYGRGIAAGVVAEGSGFNTYALRTSAAPFVLAGVTARALGRTYLLAGTQDHHAIEVNELSKKEAVERVGELLREMTLATYTEHPETAKHAVHHLPLLSLWTERDHSTGHKWGMAIDLTACTGCGACVVACQAENNVPVVGKQEVAEGREMHWLRVDRYFQAESSAGGGAHDAHAAAAENSESASHGPWDPADLDPSEVRVAHQPMLCVHCELAPCEGVCPVAATVHDVEGLNVMIYNRCIGTRYCSNNCPYKVRRFNWFYNQHGPYHPRSLKAGTSPLPGKLAQAEILPLEAMQKNPEVTVRSRGVMEKCTYCTQRINAVKIKAKNERWPNIPDGLITPACAQACPTSAIVFGDLNDPGSAVRRAHEDPRSYALLGELNTKPRTLHLAKLRNPAEDES